MCLRPQSAGSTIPRLRPTGSSLGIAPVDYDPVVLHKPFGPRLAAGALPSRASSMVAPGRPIRVPAFAVVPHEPLHTFHPLWPVRHYPHLRISVRGPGPSGTSTHLTRQLPGTRPRLSRLGATAAPPLPAALPTQGRLLKRCNVMTTYRTTLHPCTFNVGTVWDSTHPSPGIAPRRCVARHFIRSRAVLVGAAAVGFVPLRFLRDRQRCAVR